MLVKFFAPDVIDADEAVRLGNELDKKLPEGAVYQNSLGQDHGTVFEIVCDYDTTLKVMECLRDQFDVDKVEIEFV